MKKFTYLITLLCLLSLNAIAEETTILCDVETIKSSYTVEGEAIFDVIENPLKSGINTTDSVIQVSRTGTTWWALINIPVTPLVTSIGDNYIDITIKYTLQPDIGIRINTDNATYRPVAAYTNLDGWEVVRFDISAIGGTTIERVRVLIDMGYNNVPAGQVLSSTDFGYIDEIKFITSAITIPGSIDQELCNFESTETAIPAFGAEVSRILNPQNNSKNNSDSCLQIGRTSTDFYELIDIAIDDFYVPTTDKCYVHVKVKSSVALDVSLRPNKDVSPDIKANKPYTGDNEWQDLVFDLSAQKDPGYKMTNIRLLTDVQKVLNNTDILAYFDEIIVNEDTLPRINIATPLSNITNNTVEIYPNPTSSQLFITGEDVISASLYNVSGQQILHSGTLDGGIDISTLNSGIYFVKCFNTKGETIVIKRVIKD